MKLRTVFEETALPELIIEHHPKAGETAASVTVSYFARPGVAAQTRTVPFAFSLTADERRDIQWYLEQYLLLPIGEFKTRAARIEEMLTKKGTELFQAVFGVQDTFNLYSKVAEKLEETRIVIHCGADDTEGIALPWELMRDPQREPYSILSHRARAFVRSQPDLNFTPTVIKKSKTFNILLVISRPGGDDDVAFQSVARPLLELFRPHRDRIQLDILRPPTLEQLAKVLESKRGFYHIVHFDGHGVFPEGAGRQFCSQSGEAGVLLFENEDGSGHRVSGLELGRLLVNKGVPAVLLNACQSGMTHPEATYPSVGNQLLQAGVGGVVAMAYSVFVSTAVRFMARLYEELIDGTELGHAVAVARDTLIVKSERKTGYGNIRLQDWVVPVLFESATSSLTTKPTKRLRLNPATLTDEQVQAGQEVGCPRPPDFGFIGRDGVMLDLERAFRRNTVALLIGMAGVGKTEATLGFARWWAETGALEGPIFFSSFEHRRTVADICDQVGQQYQKQIKAEWKREWHLEKPDMRRKLVISLLKQIPCLLIWDNFEPVAGFPTGSSSEWTAGEQAELADFLKDLTGGETNVLISSRRDEKWLGSIYRPITIDGLRLHEAQELASIVLERAGVKANQVGDYNQLLRFLGGNPLAIQVILPELKSKQPDALLQTLKTGAATLTGDDKEQGRTRSLDASLRYRLGSLEETQCKRLGLLGMFQGFVAAGVLAAMCAGEDAPVLVQGMTQTDWTPLLDNAAEVGLLRRVGRGYYTVHPALPWFFHDLLSDAFAENPDWPKKFFIATYAQYSGELSELLQTNTEFAMRLLQAEEANLTFALRQAEKSEEWVNTGSILHSLSRLWRMQGRWVLLEQTMRDLEMKVTGQEGEPIAGRESLWVDVMTQREKIASYFRDFTSQLRINLHLKLHYEKVGDERNHAVSLHQLGMIAEERRDFVEAERWYRESLAIKERIGNDHGLAITLHQLGNVTYLNRDFVEAERWYREGLEIRERIGDDRGRSNTLHQLGMIAEERRDFVEAERWYRESLAIAERIGNDHGRANTLGQLGLLAENQGKVAEAIGFLESAAEIFERIDDPHSLAMAQRSIARVRNAEKPPPPP